VELALRCVVLQELSLATEPAALAGLVSPSTTNSARALLLGQPSPGNPTRVGLRELRHIPGTDKNCSFLLQCGTDCSADKNLETPLQIEFLVCVVVPPFECRRNRNSSTIHLCTSVFQTIRSSADPFRLETAARL
jgi:hypothetical protein